jgi:hypothetical protein
VAPRSLLADLNQPALERHDRDLHAVAQVELGHQA